MYTGIVRNVSMQDVKVSTISLEMDPKSNMYKERFCGGSLKDYINLLNANKKPLHSVLGFRKEINGITVEIALQWCVDVYSETILEYGNSIRTSDGGTHVDGVKASITRTLNSLAKKSKVIKEENITLSGEHAREGLTCIVSVNVPNHEFVGQTHSLGNQYVREIVERSVEEYLTEYFELHPNVLECIISKSYNAYKTNLAFKKARELFTSGGVSTLCAVTEKLTNNSSKKSGGGDSSGGATKHNITRRFQTKRTREQLGSDETTSIILGEPLQNTSDTSFEKKSKKPKSCVPSSYICFSSHENVGCSSIPNPEDINDKTPKDVTRRSEKAKPFIPIGPGFQAEIPIWNAPSKKGKFYGSPGDSTTLRWLGTGVWPTYNLKKKAQHKGVGEGRHDSCSCVSPWSNNCIKQHKKETRDLLEKELGREFYTMEFDRMGEVVANSWTTKEEQKFDSLVKKNPLENTEGFWEIASMAFPRKSEKDLISYYHNVFLINRMRMFVNSSGGDIDSDDDQNGDFLRK